MKRIIATLLAIGLCVFAGVVAANTFGQRQTPSNRTTTERFDNPRARESEDVVAQEQWEYLIVQGGTTNLSPSGSSSMRKEPNSAFNREAFPLEQNMDKLGAKGWELVSVTGNQDPVYFFKRRK
jgi:Icc-related predicted phosphoesterase